MQENYLVVLVNKIIFHKIKMNYYPIFQQLPFDIIREILLYDKRFAYRKQNNCLIFINKIVINDNISSLLKKIPKIFQISTNNWQVIIGSNWKRFVLSHRLKLSQSWEYGFSTFSKDNHTNIMNSYPDSSIYLPII